MSITPVAIYEIRGFATDLANQKDMIYFEKKTFPLTSIFLRLQKSKNPWTIQSYVTDEQDLQPLYDTVVNSINPK